jgi:nitrate reductase gamma subunit
MSIFSFFVGQIMPYMTLLIFVMGITYKIVNWNKAAQGKITLYPAPSTWVEKWKRIIKEVLVFQSLFEGNKSLWLGTWVFHLSLALIILGHARVVTDSPLVWKTLQLGQEDADALSALVGGGAGLLILIMGLYLLFRRVAIQRVKEISDGEDYVALVLILAIIITGDIMRFMTHFDLTESRNYLRALFTFRVARIPADPAFICHFFLGQVLVIYIPFSKFLHIPGVFFAKSIIYQE